MTVKGAPTGATSQTGQATFEQRFRQGKIAPPTARNFDAGAWRAALEEDPTSDGAEFIRAGIWFARALQSRWTQLDELGLAAMSVDGLSRHVAGAANLMHLHVDAQIHRARLGANRRSLSTGSIAH